MQRRYGTGNLFNAWPHVPELIFSASQATRCAQVWIFWEAQHLYALQGKSHYGVITFSLTWSWRYVKPLGKLESLNLSISMQPSFTVMIVFNMIRGYQTPQTIKRSSRSCNQQRIKALRFPHLLFRTDKAGQDLETG
jgi:hypothetical protein